MTDERTLSVIQQLRTRCPEARVEVQPPPNDESIRIPDLLIVLDGDVAARRRAEDLALELTRAAFPGEAMPYVVNVVTPEVEARYRHDTAASFAAAARP